MKVPRLAFSAGTTESRTGGGAAAGEGPGSELLRVSFVGVELGGGAYPGDARDGKHGDGEQSSHGDDSGEVERGFAEE